MTDPTLQGRLESFKLPDVFTFLAAALKSGTLAVQCEAKEANVFFDNGALVFAASNQESLRLGAILLRKNKISAEQARDIERLMLADGARFGAIAMQQGVLTEEQLRDFLKIQVSEILYDCFLWRGGTFAFRDELELPRYAVTIAIDLGNLIMEGARRIAEWDECVRLLPDSSVVFRVVANPESEKITLSLEEWKILFLINGQRSLDDLCGDSDDRVRIYRLVYGLFANKLIEPVSNAARSLDDSDRGLTRPMPPVLDSTVRQAPANFGAESTLREMKDDDTSLLISSEARLSYHDVVTTTVAQLVIPTDGTVFPLSEPEYTIGRQRDNTIQIHDLGVSGHHARIFRGPEGYIIEDLKSRNGTWLNGMRIYHALLQDGDQLKIGATDLRFQVLYDGNRTVVATNPS